MVHRAVPKPTWAILPPSKLLDGKEAFQLLGRIVFDPADPTGWYVPATPSADLLDLFCPSEVVEDSIASVTSQELPRSTRVHLGEIFGIESSIAPHTGIQIKSEVVLTRYIRQYPKVFRRIVQNDQAEILEMLQKKPMLQRTVYMVVGVKTCLDAELSSNISFREKLAANLDFPVAEIVLATTGLPLPDFVNPGVGVEREQISKVLTKQTAKGERLFALQYMRIKHRKDWLKEPRPEFGALHSVDPGRGLFSSISSPLNDEDSDDDDDEDEDEDEDDNPERPDIGGQLSEDTTIDGVLLSPL